MKKIALVVSLCVMSGPAFANCTADAKAKNLAGAALTSFLGKCKRDAETACTADSDSRKLAGAARISHMRKCVNDKVGT